jgi:hypothetical protein
LPPVRAVLLLGVFVSGCGLTTQVRPTPEKTLAVQAAVGGPMANVGAPVPLPLGTLGVAWGFNHRADLSVHTHVTTLALSGVFGFDLGVSVLALEQHAGVPALTVGVRGYAFSDFKSAALGFYESSLAASWDVGRFRPFVAVAVQLDLQALQFDLAPAVGTEIRFGRFTLVVDLKWYAPTRDTTVSSAPWVGLGGRGALGLVLGGRYDVQL